MADLTFNGSKGKVAELAARVNANDPANSALVIVVLAATGLETDAVLLDKDTLADVLAGTTNEATNANYARKVLDQTAGITITTDDVNDRVDVDIPDQTWLAVAAAGGAFGKLVVCYDPDTTGGTDANIVPLTMHDFAVTPDGSDIIAQIAAGGFFRAS
jgi:hypothetical protein